MNDHRIRHIFITKTVNFEKTAKNFTIFKCVGQARTMAYNNFSS